MLPLTFQIASHELYGGQAQSVTLYDGLTILLGPNGTGKSRFLRATKDALQGRMSAIGRRVRYLSSGRLAQLDLGRGDLQGRGSIDENVNLGQARHRTTGWFLNSEGILGDAHQLVGRPDLQIKVSERLRRLFRRDVTFDWEDGNLRLNFTRTDRDSGLYRSTREASGLLHLLSLLTALYDDKVGALLIDEPELSLHPQLQAFILDEVRRVAGDPEVDPSKKLVILATHASPMVVLRTPSDLTRLFTFNDPDMPPRRIEPSDGLLSARPLTGLIARVGARDKDVLFSRTPILVEGPSDLAVASAVAARLDLPLGAAGAHLLPVGGTDSFSIATKLFKQLGKPPVIIADLDVLADGTTFCNALSGTPALDDKAVGAGHDSFTGMATSTLQDFGSLVQRHWDEVQAFASTHAYCTQRGSGTSEDLVRRRAVMGTLLSTGDTDLTAWGAHASEWTQIRRRLMVLIEMLASGGVFVLRRGTIEQYYATSPQGPLEKKVALADAEAETILATLPQAIHSRYPELTAALTFAADLPTVNESDLVRDLTAQLVAPLMLHLDEPQAALRSRLTQILGDRAALFGVLKEDNGGTPALVVSLISPVLEVNGFPLRLRKGDNIVHDLERAIHQRPRDA